MQTCTPSRSCPSPSLWLIHSSRGAKRSGCPPCGWGSATLFSLCAEQWPRGLEEERGPGCAACPRCCCPCPAFLHPPQRVTSPPHPSPRVLCLGGDPPERCGRREGRKRWWRLRTRPDIPSASVLLQLLGIMEVAVSVSPCLTVYNMATFL